ncbi:hypothetical protein [Aestuariimicrobium sp. Y1814]|uniref:hypothetical protein n=1 Tax=Aestuariimicrobium sp. Y1814 TaxID=3418742 RepID=UPI003DA6E7DC
MTATTMPRTSAMVVPDPLVARWFHSNTPPNWVEDFGRRVLADAMTSATASYWLRRARAFEDARPRPGDFTGRATAAELAELDRRCRETAEACRSQAALWVGGEDR